MIGSESWLIGTMSDMPGDEPSTASGRSSACSRASSASTSTCRTPGRPEQNICNCTASAARTPARLARGAGAMVAWAVIRLSL